MVFDFLGVKVDGSHVVYDYGYAEIALFGLRIRFRSVVLPAPRKPESRVTGKSLRVVFVFARLTSLSLVEC